MAFDRERVGRILTLGGVLLFHTCFTGGVLLLAHLGTRFDELDDPWQMRFMLGAAAPLACVGLLWVHMALRGDRWPCGVRVIASLGVIGGALCLAFGGAGWWLALNASWGQPVAVPVTGTVVDKVVSRGNRGGKHYTLVLATDAGLRHLNCDEAHFQRATPGASYQRMLYRGRFGVLYGYPEL